MSFIWPWMLITLLLVPLFIWGTTRLHRSRQHAALELKPLDGVQDDSGRSPERKRHILALFSLLGLSLLFFGLSRPEMFIDLPRVEGTVILAFDVSSSMTADDVKPTRIEAAKVAARVVVENQPGTVRLGVVAFGNGGLVVQYPTKDQTAVFAAIDRLNPQGATSLAQGIYSALTAIAGKAIPIDLAAIEENMPIDIGSYPSAVVLLFTDGENTASLDPLEITQLAAESGVRIYPVGIGSPEGVVLQIDGFNVLSRLDEKILKEIADLTNGAYYYTADSESLHKIYRDVDLQLTVRGEKMEVTALFAGLGLLFFLFGGLLSLFWFGRMPL